MADKKIDCIDIHKFMDSCEDSCELVPNTTAYFNWSLKGFGFGQLYFYMKDGKVYCHNETMDKDTVKKILGILVDQAMFDES